MRRSKPVRIGELWSGFVEESPQLTRGLREARIPEIWPRIVGAPLASLTSSVEVKNGILHVCVTSSPARHELFMRREQIRSRINAELGLNLIRSVIVK